MAKKALKSAAGGTLPARIIVHASPTLVALHRKALAADLRAAAPSLPPVKFLDDLASAPQSRAFLRDLASARVRDARVPDEFLEATSGDVEFEANVDLDPDRVSSAVLAGRLYDGNRASKAAFSLIRTADRTMDALHMWVTRRLLATYSPEDYRYHARYAVFAYPSLFSVLGLGLAPAASVEATLFARELGRRGATAAQIEQEIDKEYPEERVDIDDPAAVTGSVASALLQASAALAGEGPFCSDPACRLFNPHRKAELRTTMLGGKLCATHRRLFGPGGRGA